MTEVESLLLEHLKRFQTEMTRLRESLDSNTRALWALQHHVAGLITSGTNQEAEVAALKLRVERIERRLDLVD